MLDEQGHINELEDIEEYEKWETVRDITGQWVQNIYQSAYPNDAASYNQNLSIFSLSWDQIFMTMIIMRLLSAFTAPIVHLKMTSKIILIMIMTWLLF